MRQACKFSERRLGLVVTDVLGTDDPVQSYFTFKNSKLLLFLALLSVLAGMLYNRFGLPPLGSTTLIKREYQPFMSASNYNDRYVENDRFQKTHVFESGDQKRNYKAYMPRDLGEGIHPVIFLFHGSGRSGAAMVERWIENADEEGIVLIAPDGLNENWGRGSDMTSFLPDLVEDAAKHYPIDKERMFLFGHSSGGVYVNYMSQVYPDLFLAAAIHGALLKPGNFPATDKDEKMPFMYIVGTKDIRFPVWPTERSARAMARKGHHTELVLLSGHTHWYYDLAPQINAIAWSFFEEVQEQASQH